jgi:DNA polymerase I-like protein with 3'-5' exonuclease and polymerase domains
MPLPSRAHTLVLAALINFAGFVVTLTGRRRYLPDVNSTDEAKRMYAERQAVNSVIQGTAS